MWASFGINNSPQQNAAINQFQPVSHVYSEAATLVEDFNLLRSATMRIHPKAILKNLSFVL
jgi:hypothetical protein